MIHFTLKELNPQGHPLSEEHKKNLNILIEKVSAIREAYGKPMIVTSGYRSRQDQERIYKNAQRVPYGSAHLSGEAVDIFDRDKTLASFVLANIPLLEKLGLYCEDPSRTSNWLHFQTRKPPSGSRFFTP